MVGDPSLPHSLQLREQLDYIFSPWVEGQGLPIESDYLQGYGLDGVAPVDGRVYLHHMSSYELLHRVCAGVAFTAQPFQSKALGLSFTSVRNSLGRNGDQIGGICDRPRGSGLSFNALTITLMPDALASPYYLQKSMSKSEVHLV
ncbi:unnamed protein product [Timema podura]|uniref:Uncharacterized protein n=1 Tax=Timema podura TaxID=61482 RepID=A0ABN7NP98_TIMPD|nr:unnamed protein product [Timema podura]